MNNAIEVKSLTKSYPGFILDDISFCLPSGCIMGLIGENGAGKSTLIKLIMDVIDRDAGEISVLGKDSRTDFSQTKEHIGVVLDETYFPDTFCISHVSAVMKHTYRYWDEKAFLHYVKRLALPEKKAFRNYSRGMKMKLAIAVALSHDTRLLILDEATSGLDPIVRDEVLEIFYDFTREEDHSILISSHIVSDLEKLCDYITFLHGGKMLFCEEKDLLLEQYGILRCTRKELENIPPDAIRGVRSGTYETAALVETAKISGDFTVDKAGVEDIIIFLGKEAYGK